MKTSPGMLGTGKLFSVLFLIPHLGIWNIDGEKSCDAQLYVKRHSVNISAGTSYQLECPVEYCTSRPNVTWCKLRGNSCLDLEYSHRKHIRWESRKNMSVLILYFDQVLASDNGSYRCSAIVPSGLIESHSITIYVTEHTRNDSKHLLKNTTGALEPPSKEQTEDRRWILYSLLPLGGLPLLITCFCLFCCLRKHQGKQKKPSDTEEKEINLVNVPQPFRSEQTEVSIRQNSQTLPSDTRIYDNDPCFKVQEETGIHSNPCLEENKQGIVYASLNHSVIGMNPRQARNMKEAPTEYAAICVRS
ncbi:B- and T-lymphocyte attenuator isoform X2 [Rousettus aegyptiacus]|uniref:B and T lymphocyte associated n=2 Tax=Rousettus aegyptiacus TaxID=9407 RepID=A0A7J8HN45_ROUAE|nr:B- and T-lymphocyte attenuator isoform X2 [Rousettus aegyptiacus]KAF6473345.1 B and T lymphocyte associated [Rousettus aegyptiacus]